MKNISNLKTIHSLLVLAALIIFMAAPYVSYGGKYEVSGIDLLEDMSDDNSWLVLFIVTPLLALFANLFNGCTFRQLATLSMGVPIIMLFAKFDYAETAWGSIVHIMLTIGALVTSFLFPNSSNIVAEDEPDAAPAPGNGPTADTPAPSTPPAQKVVATKEKSVRAYKTQKLKEIVENAAMYRPELVERCRQELSIRKKSKAFTEQVAAMDDARLHEILSDRTQYAEELIYACEREQSRRRRAQLEQQKLQQEQQQEQLRIQQEQQAEAERQAREQRAKEEAERQAVRDKQLRKYLIIGTILLALIAIGVSGYTYYKKQEALRILKEQEAAERRIIEEKQIQQQREQERQAEAERIAAEKKREQQRIAAEKAAEQQRIAEEKAAEERRLAEEKAAEEKRLAEEKAAEERRLEELRQQQKRAQYKLGDLFVSRNGTKGIVISEGSANHSILVLSLQEYHCTWDIAIKKCIDGWVIPSLNDFKYIAIHKNTINEHMKAHNGKILSHQIYWTSNYNNKDIWCYKIFSNIEVPYSPDNTQYLRLIRKL